MDGVDYVCSGSVANDTSRLDVADPDRRPLRLRRDEPRVRDELDVRARLRGRRLDRHEPERIAQLHVRHDPVRLLDRHGAGDDDGLGERRREPRRLQQRLRVRGRRRRRQDRPEQPARRDRRQPTRSRSIRATRPRCTRSVTRRPRRTTGRSSSTAPATDIADTWGGTSDFGLNCNMTGGSSGGPWYVSFDSAGRHGIAQLGQQLQVHVGQVHEVHVRAVLRRLHTEDVQRGEDGSG